jgi:tRNA threonylcarbamoyladenosine biosynthesis protein TsaE
MLLPKHFIINTMIHTITSEQAMKQWAARFAADFKGGEIIELIGDVGAGKTTFVKGVAAALGITETVQSPSFTLFARYEAPDGRSLHHYDFYRLDDPGVIAYNLAESVADPTAVTVVEWGSTVTHVLPEARIIIHISPGSETSRELKVEQKPS